MKTMINGKIIDPDKKYRHSSLFVKEGKILEPEKGATASQIIDLKGYYISPGFIDGHVHIFQNSTEIGVQGDDIGIKQGVTTLIDAGSAGYNDFPRFKKESIEANQTTIYSLINLSKTGLVTNLHELTDLKNIMSLEEARELFAMYPDLIKGIKVRLSSSVVGDNGVKPLEQARVIADSLSVPIMVHIGNPPPYLPAIFPLLKKGDIVTHSFHGKQSNTILDSKNRLIPAAKQAIERGIRFDVGHGSASFSFDVFEAYMENYRDIPFSCSTDLHKRNYSQPVGSLMLTLAKLLSFNMSIEQLVESVTKLPRESFKLSQKGRLTKGSDADFTVFDVVEEEVTLQDSSGRTRTATRVIKPKMTILDGNVVWQAKDY